MYDWYDFDRSLQVRMDTSTWSSTRTPVALKLCKKCHSGVVFNKQHGGKELTKIRSFMMFHGRFRYILDTLKIGESISRPFFFL